MMKYYSGMIDEGGWKTAAGDIAVFSTKYRRDLKSLVVSLEPVQAGSGDPSPDNIRPITGRTGATVWRTGKNLYHYDANNVSTCTMNSNVTRGIYFTGIRGGTYTFSAIQNGNDTTTTYINISGYKNGIATIKNSFLIPNSIIQRTFTFDSDEYVVFTSASELPASISLNLQKYNIQIEPGTTATEYEPYTGTTIPVSWETEAGTMYGGELDVVSGKLMVDRAIVDLGSLTWQYRSNNIFSSSGIGDYKYSNNVYAICSNYKFIGVISSYEYIAGNKTVALYYNASVPSARSCYIKDSTYSDAATFKDAMSGVQLCYELATPQTYQLTPQQIQTLIGDNVVWSDAGQVTVEYWG